jgi:hypothetical protein
MPDHTYWNMMNAECRQENSIASRLGRSVITAEPALLGGANAPLADENIHTLARLKGLENPYRYAGANQDLYRGTLPASEVSPYATINGSFIFSGNRFSTANYRPNDTSTPYIYFADSQVMTKDNGTLTTLQQWGIFPPTAPPTLSLGNALTEAIDNFSSLVGDYTLQGFTGGSNVTLVTTTLGTAITTAPGTFTVRPPSMSGIIPNMILNVDTGGFFEQYVFVVSTTPTTFTGYFMMNHVSSAQVSNNGLQLTCDGPCFIEHNFVFSAATAAQLELGGGYITVGLQVSDYTKLINDDFSVIFNVPGGGYVARYVSNPAIPVPTTNNYTEITISISDFEPTGIAGSPGSTWANVSSWGIEVGSTSSITVTFGDFSYFGGNGPSVTDGGATPYNYRITFYNSVTGTESGPSVVQIPTAQVSPVGQPVTVNFAAAVTPPPPIDPQITNIRIYRLGGTLPNQWLQVGQVPIGTTTFIDTNSDEQIAAANILDVDTAPPVTSTLPVPLNVVTGGPITVGENTVLLVGPLSANLFVNQLITIDSLLPTEETVIIQAITGGDQITGYFQYAHASGAAVTASTRAGQPCYLAAIAFNRAWLAGDPNNPDILYYSDPFNPESFPVENFVELGSPSDPIMAIVEWNGQLYVLTQNTVWNILGAQSGTPLPFKTAAKHGLNAPFGWCVTEGEIYYQSFGGIYAFQGSDSRYASFDIEWVFTAQFIADDINRAVPLMDPTQVSQTLMAYYQNEIYVSYIAQNSERYRVIYDKVHARWRNDDVATNSMLVQEDIYTLIFGTTVGMIYQDRTGNYDTNGLGAGITAITMNLQTAAIDMGMPKNFKNFNEFTIDIDTGGQTVLITLLFDYGQTSVSLGGITSSGRAQYQFNINEGEGQLSLNVSVLLTAEIVTDNASPVEVYECHIRATPEAEVRQSYDSYLMDFGSPDYKFVKQGWFEYTALDPAGITFNCYVDGGLTAPTFSFALPKSLNRTTVRVRFPATKGRVWRWIATSASDFRLYSDSRIEWKPVTQDKGYELRPLQQEMPQQP